MTKYDKSMIYKICCKDLSIQDIYIGSTINFRNRKWKHKSACNNVNDVSYLQPKYEFIRNHGGWNNWEMIQIKEVNCNSKLELQAEERKTYEELKPTLNYQFPNRKQKESQKVYTTKNKEKIKQKAKIYREKNKEKTKQMYKEKEIKIPIEVKKYRQEKILCDCGCYVSREGISKHKKTNKHKKNMLLL